MKGLLAALNRAKQRGVCSQLPLVMGMGGHRMRPVESVKPKEDTVLPIIDVHIAQADINEESRREDEALGDTINP